MDKLMELIQLTNAERETMKECLSKLTESLNEEKTMRNRQKVEFQQKIDDLNKTFKIFANELHETKENLKMRKKKFTRPLFQWEMCAEKRAITTTKWEKGSKNWNLT